MLGVSGSTKFVPLQLHGCQVRRQRVDFFLFFGRLLLGLKGLVFCCCALTLTSVKWTSASFLSRSSFKDCSFHFRYLSVTACAAFSCSANLIFLVSTSLLLHRASANFVWSSFFFFLLLAAFVAVSTTAYSAISCWTPLTRACCSAW